MTTAAPPRAGTWLVGDVGGTHLRLGVVREDDLQPRGTVVLPRAGHRDLASAVTGYLSGIAGRHRPSAACIAVAAPVAGDEVRLTNADFAFSTARTREQLDLAELLIVNDLEAQARSVAALRRDDVVQLTEAGLRHDRTIAVVSPGTGLGVAALVPTRSGPVVVAGEGGQAPLPASCTAAVAIAPALLAEQGHVSGEDLVCGGGLPRLDREVRRLAGRTPEERTAAQVGSSGESAPGQVLDVFVELLAAVVQSHVLTLGARGGVVLGGGILPGLVPVLRSSGLVDRFVAHPKMRSYLEAVPVVVDTRPCPALTGAALLLQDRA